VSTRQALEPLARRLFTVLTDGCPYPMRYNAPDAHSAESRRGDSPPHRARTLEGGPRRRRARQRGGPEQHDAASSQDVSGHLCPRGGGPSASRWGRAHGWRAVSQDGLEYLLDESDHIAVLVSTGDAGTGCPELHVSTKYPRGPRSQDVLESNQLSFIVKGRPMASPRKTWLLLLRQTEEQILSEFSLAAAIGEDGHIALWTERIMLPPLDLGSAPGPATPELEPTEAVDIPLARRS